MIIHESFPWKEELFRHRAILERDIFLGDGDWEENTRALARVEKAVLFSATIMRVLGRSAKITDSTANQQVLVRSYKRISDTCKAPRHLDLRLGQHFDMDSKLVCSIPIQKICSEIIHSEVFVWTESPACKLDGFIISSEYNNDKRALGILFKDITPVITSFIEDEVTSIMSTRHSISRKWSERVA